MLEIGTLKDISDFDLSKILVRKNLKLSARFNTFSQAMESFKAISKSKYISPINGELVQFKCNFQNPEPNYFDGKFCTKFENCIKGKF